MLAAEPASGCKPRRCGARLSDRCAKPNSSGTGRVGWAMRPLGGTSSTRPRRSPATSACRSSTTRASTSAASSSSSTPSAAWSSTSTCPVKDDEYPTDDYGYQRVYFGPGPQLMDGHTALQYARSRHGTSDFARAGRQQKVIVSLRNRALQLNMLSKAPELVGIIQKSLSTDLTPVQMLSLGKLRVADRSRQDHQPGHRHQLRDAVQGPGRRRPVAAERASDSAGDQRRRALGGAPGAARKSRGAQRQRHGRPRPEGGRLPDRAGLQHRAHRRRRAQRLQLVGRPGARRRTRAPPRRW